METSTGCFDIWAFKRACMASLRGLRGLGPLGLAFNTRIMPGSEALPCDVRHGKNGPLAVAQGLGCAKLLGPSAWGRRMFAIERFFA